MDAKTLTLPDTKIVVTFEPFIKYDELLDIQASGSTEEAARLAFKYGIRLCKTEDGVNIPSEEVTKRVSIRDGMVIQDILLEMIELEAKKVKQSKKNS